MTGVANVQERNNYREFSKSGDAPAKSRSLGSLGDLLRGKLAGAGAALEAEPAPRSEKSNVRRRRTTPE
jgi:hypothetical protein